MVDARIKKSQQALLQAGLQLINKNKSISLKEIAEHAAVGRATLYRLYSSKEMLVEAIAIDCFQRFNDAAMPIEKQAKSAVHAIEMLFDLLMPLEQEFQFLISLEYFADQSEQVSTIMQQQNQELELLIEQAKNEGSIDKKLPTTWVRSFFESLFITAYAEKNETQRDYADLAKLAYLCFKKAMKPRLFG